MLLGLQKKNKKNNSIAAGLHQAVAFKWPLTMQRG